MEQVTSKFSLLQLARTFAPTVSSAWHAHLPVTRSFNNILTMFTWFAPLFLQGVTQLSLGLPDKIQDTQLYLNFRSVRSKCVVEECPKYCTGHAYSFLFAFVFVFWEGGEGQRERENLKQAPHPAWSRTRGPLPQPRDHGPSRNQELDA